MPTEGDDGNTQCDITDADFQASINKAVGSNNYTVGIDEADLWGSDYQTQVDASCYDKYAFFYAQFTCIMPERTQHLKYNQVATNAAIICFIAYLFTIAIRHLFQGGKIQQIQWDMATVTAGDYTAELIIDNDGYRSWYDNVYKAPNVGDFEKNKMAPAMSLKKHLIHEIEEILTADLKRSPLQEANDKKKKKKGENV